MRAALQSFSKALRWLREKCAQGCVVEPTAVARDAQARTFKGSRASGVIISDLPSWPMKRSRNTGWSMMPRIGRVPSCNAINVPQVWRPVMKGRVPSIGSRIQVLPLVPASWPRSSPRMPSVGRSAWISFRIASSAPRSASVTGSYIGRGPVAPLSITAICLRKKGRTTVPASSARRLAKASVAGSIVMESSYQGAALNPPPLRWKKRIHAEFLQFLTQRHRATEGGRIACGVFRQGPGAQSAPKINPIAQYERGRLLWLCASVCDPFFSATPRLRVEKPSILSTGLLKEIFMKSVVVTGASTGIGWGCTKVLIAKGFKVYGSVRKQADADRLSKEFGANFVPLLCDVTDTAAVRKAADQVARALGNETLAGLVNNAGIAVAGPLLYLDVDELRQQLEVNVTGQLIVTQAFAPLLGADVSRYANTIYAASLNKIKQFMITMGRQGLPSEKIGAAVWKALTLRKPKVHYTVTPDPLQNFMTTHLPKRTVDNIVAGRLGLKRKSA